jgi:hypothetical protein
MADLLRGVEVVVSRLFPDRGHIGQVSFVIALTEHEEEM